MPPLESFFAERDMSLDGEEAPPAFSNIRNRFEELTRAGPSRPSNSANRTVGLRTSSDRLHDRITPPGSVPPRPTQLSVAPQFPPRHRVKSNPDLSELGSLNTSVRLNALSVVICALFLIDILAFTITSVPKSFSYICHKTHNSSPDTP